MAVDPRWKFCANASVWNFIGATLLKLGRTSYDTVVGSKAATVINNLTKIRSSWVSRINWQLTFSPGTGLYEISIRLNRSMWRERRRLDVTVPNSGKLEIYLSNLPAARFSATLVPWQFFIIRKWVVILMRQILNVVQDVGPPSRVLLHSFVKRIHLFRSNNIKIIPYLFELKNRRNVEPLSVYRHHVRKKKETRTST